MNFQSLISSSKGNAYIVSDGQTKILIECGTSLKRLKELCGFTLSEIDACLVSHEHKDHSDCADKLIKNMIPVYMSQGTAAALGLPEALLELAREAKSGEMFTVGTMDILPFDTMHNTQEPLGFMIQSRADGDILVFAIDTVNLPYDFPGVNIMAVEADYDDAILECCDHLPEKTKQRIRNSHMEIETLCRCLKRMDLSSCREIHLMHLSDATSHEGHFIHKVQRAVPAGIRVTACGR